MSRTHGYWIMYHEDYCPVCGRTQVYRERVYDEPKPVEWSARHIVREVYDWCEP